MIQFTKIITSNGIKYDLLLDLYSLSFLCGFLYSKYLSFYYSICFDKFKEKLINYRKRMLLATNSNNCHLKLTNPAL